MPEALPDRVDHRGGDVEPREVHQLERAHAQPQDVPGDPVDPGGIGDRLLQQRQGLGDQPPAGVVDEEAGGVGHGHRPVPAALDQRREHRRDPGAGGGARYDLDDLHQRYGVEEVQTGQPARVPQRGGDPGHRQGRGVGREDRGLRQRLFQLPEDLGLGVQVLAHGLHDQLDLGARRPRVVQRDQPLQGRGGILGGHPALVDRAFQHRPYEVHARCHRLGPDVAEFHGVPADGGPLGDAAAHGSGADDPDTHGGYVLSAGAVDVSDGSRGRRRKMRAAGFSGGRRGRGRRPRAGGAARPRSAGARS